MHLVNPEARGRISCCTRRSWRWMTIFGGVRAEVQRQITAEREKRALIAASEGRRQEQINIATGEREAYIARSEGERQADINKALKDIMAGKTAVSVKTKKLRGKAIVSGGAGTATRTIGLLGGILTAAYRTGIVLPAGVAGGDADAARIDGCSEWGVLLRVIIPMAKPGIAAAAIFMFFNSWNDYYGPLLYASENDAAWPVAYGLATFRGAHGTDWSITMAITVLVMIPVVLIFFFAQRVFVEGITLTGVKG